MVHEERELGDRLTALMANIIIISGLLTTSSYPAIYSPFVRTAPEGDTTMIESWFRATNAASFSLSLIAISFAFIVIFLVHKENGLEAANKKEYQPIYLGAANGACCCLASTILMAFVSNIIGGCIFLVSGPGMFVAIIATLCAFVFAISLYFMATFIPNLKKRETANRLF